jgi:hypothetical protein
VPELPEGGRGEELTVNETVEVKGNTYPVRQQLKALGARWDAGARVWRVAADRAREAQALVAAAPRESTPRYRTAPNGCSERQMPAGVRNLGAPKPGAWGPLPAGHLEVERGEGYGGSGARDDVRR